MRSLNSGTDRPARIALKRALLDVNVVLALLDEGRAEHEVAAGWWQGFLRDGGRVFLAHEVALSVIRLAANPKVTRTPVLPATTHAAIRGFLDQDRIALLAPNEDSWAALGPQLIGVTGYRMVHDVHLAAFAQVSGTVLVTFDRHFLRFNDLEVELLDST